MRLIKQTEEYVADTEQEAIQIIEEFRSKAQERNYVVGANGYTYKTKKSKGEIVDEIWLTKVTKILGGMWDE